MSLTSPIFLFGFLPVAVFGAYALRAWAASRAAQLWLVACSLAFYAFDGVSALPLLLASIGANWAFAKAIDAAPLKSAARTRWLRIGIVANVTFLCVFKYADLLMIALRDVGHFAVVPPHWSFPLGISFFTLSQIMYLVDCYERMVPATSIIDHLTVYAWFPNVTAGPLVRAKKFLGQLPDLASFPSESAVDERLARGLCQLTIGLFKKAVLADSFSFLANAGYANVRSLSMLEAWVVTMAYAFEMYFDFSGYSDIALGVSRLMGIELPRNFNAPFRAVNISDFWQRWHISLSSFITTYLYSPLVRLQKRPTVAGSAAATLFAMTIAGLWHGASWTYLLFYVMHGTALAGYQFWKRRKLRVPRLASIGLTFAFINLCFVMFRSPDVSTALLMTSRMLPLHDLVSLSTLGTHIVAADLSMIALPVLLGAVVAFGGPTSEELSMRCAPTAFHMSAVVGALIVSAAFLVSSAGSPFIYRMF